MADARRIGFTLIELLVVISIIGVLAAALITPITKAREMAWAAHCKANLKNLAQAANSYAVGDANGDMPCAGPSERFDTRRGLDGTRKLRYYEVRGWVNWTSDNTGGGHIWDDSTISIQGGSLKAPIYYKSSANDTRPFYSITNGTLWAYVGKDLGTYVCGVHQRLEKENGAHPLIARSYVMNCYFGYANRGRTRVPDWTGINGRAARGTVVRLENLSSRGNAGNLLLFAELPAPTGYQTYSMSSEYAMDGVLETDLRKDVSDPDSTEYFNKTASERIGFNHKVGRKYVAHVAFADGHVDALAQLKEGASDKDYLALMQQLCNGDEIDADLRRSMQSN